MESTPRGPRSIFFEGNWSELRKLVDEVDKTYQELLGHTTLDMTLKHSHLSPDHKRRAVDFSGPENGHYMDTGAKNNRKTTSCEVTRIKL